MIILPWSFYRDHFTVIILRWSFTVIILPWSFYRDHFIVIILPWSFYRDHLTWSFYGDHFTVIILPWSFYRDHFTVIILPWSFNVIILRWSFTVIIVPWSLYRDHFTVIIYRDHLPWSFYRDHFTLIIIPWSFYRDHFTVIILPLIYCTINIHLETHYMMKLSSQEPSKQFYIYMAQPVHDDILLWQMFLWTIHLRCCAFLYFHTVHMFQMVRCSFYNCMWYFCLCNIYRICFRICVITSNSFVYRVHYSSMGSFQ